jgi:hypothetical protein
LEIRNPKYQIGRRSPGFQFLCLLILLTTPTNLFGIGQSRYVEFAPNRGSFPVVGPTGASPIYVDAADWPGVVRAVSDLQADIQRVTTLSPPVVRDANGRRPSLMILVGTIGKSVLIDQLIQEKKLDVSGISGKWESFILQTIENPLPA